MSKELILVLGLIAAVGGVGQTNSHDRQQGGNPPTSQPAKGDSAAGKAVFSGAGNCFSCHRVGAAGSVVGPNLSDVGSRLSADEIRRQLTDPPASIDPRNRLYEVALANGKSIEGKLLNQDQFSVQMLNTNGDLVAYSRSEIREMRAIDPPLMPSYKTSLTSEQIDNLVAYLQSLRTPAV